MSHSFTQLLSLTLSSLVLLATTTTASPVSTSSHIKKRALHLTRGASAGLGIGIAIAAVILVVVIFLLILHFRQRSYISAWERKHHPKPTPHTEKHASASSAATTLNGDHALSNVQTQAHDIEMSPPDYESKQLEPQVSTIPRRQKSLKDHLMGPLYRDGEAVSTPMPAHVRRARIQQREQERSTRELDEEFLRNKEMNVDGGTRDAVPSFSSRRATRMMMYM